jgi:FkbM family methyltransferase
MNCHRCPTPVGHDAARFNPGHGGPDHYLCDSCARAVIAHVTSTPTMTREAMQTPFPIVSRGKVYQILCAGEAWHPSWWSFSDELETRELWWDIKPGDVVADVGADFGSYTLSALAQGAGRVYAWSPPFKHPTEPLECATLWGSARLNGWQDRLSLTATGLWSQAGHLTVTDWNKLGEFTAGPVDRPGALASFAVHTLDSMNLPKLDFLKCDTEGAEMEVFTGAEQTIRRCKPRILFENHVHIDPDCEAKCRAFLEPMGYRWVGTRPHHSISHTLMVPE